ncbi:MAG: hypothetical protein HFE39_07940 [Clostridiales bacterium]|jgi:hypothetical protein|nr:hypothetical protein [Clostridiales bacterium]
MDDLAGKISELLNNPESLEKIKGLSGLLGQSPMAPQPEPEINQNSAPDLGSMLSADTLQTVMKLAPLFSSMKQDDNSTRLLHALRPMLGAKRQQKLDQSIKMMQMIRILPLLKNTGIL